MRVTHYEESINFALVRADPHAPFLRNLAARRPRIVARLAAGGLTEALAEARRDAAAQGDPARALRRERQGVALAVALADLAGLAPFEEVVAALSDFADRAFDTAIRTAIDERTPGAAPVGFAGLALGKHGSRELNYSSDIDPILIFDPATLPCRPREEPADAAVRIARRMIELLQTRDGDGYVLRVDLRLRPSPEATPLALPIDAAIAYYESSALPWERAAFIRARAAAGDLALGQRFLAAVRPFVWRRALDFGASGELRAISRCIRDHHAQAQALGPGWDVKRGRGGIRECEFFAQIHQLIHGGRDPALRAPATLDALAALARAGWIGGDDAAALAAAYRLERTIEHRLQMVDDAQTHRLPRDAAALDNVARLHGLADGAALIALLAPHAAAAGRIYDALDPAPGSGLSHDPALLDAALHEAGFADPARARARIADWRSGAPRALRTEPARAALESVLPGLVAAIGRAADPMVALNRFDALVTGVPSALSLFRLLDARPALAALLGDILTHAPALASELGRRPVLLDGLIDASALAPAPPLDALVAEFAAREAGDDYGLLIDRVRQKVNERRFALGTQLVAGTADPLAVAAGYARVAESAIEVLAAATVDEFERAYGRVPGADFAILALGRLGGGVLTHASDLDLVYLFTGDHLAESDGPRALGATHYFNRLAQRVSAALSVPTASGPLYQVDTRLRPSGAQGLLAVSTASFAQYQREGAWTWEHMALARARPVFGPPAARAEIAGVIATTLAQPRDPAKLVTDAAAMRGEIAKHKPPCGAFDVKLATGGLVDAEFAIHVQQLRHHVGLDPHLATATDALVAAGLLPAGFAAAQALLTRMLVVIRLVSPSCDEPPAVSHALVARACGCADWTDLLAVYAGARQIVADTWRQVAMA